jgi:hypothetical protein
VVNICDFGANILFRKKEKTKHSLIHEGGGGGGGDDDDDDDIFDFFIYVYSLGFHIFVRNANERS